jgi:hypothetical protein
MRRLIIPIILSVPATIIFVIIASLTTEFTIWQSFATLLLFPYTMLATLAYPFTREPPALIHTIFLQVPLYGIIIGIAWVKGHLKSVLIFLLVSHLIAAGLAVKYAGPGSRGLIGICCSENKK